jgi:hypothetical protein
LFNAEVTDMGGDARYQYIYIFFISTAEGASGLSH